MKNKFKNKKILVLGLSKSGISAAQYLNKTGANVWLSEYSPIKDEQQQKEAEELKQSGINVECGQHSEEFIKGTDFVVISPGISPQTEIYKTLQKKGITIISEIELAYLSTDRPFIAITGTNGKTTTTALISHILEYNAPGTAPVCGNIGIAPTSLLEINEIKYFVCEVSSYQAQNSPTFTPYIACYMNFTPDHINWHGSLENYFEAKAKLFAKDKKPAFAILNNLDKKVYSLAENFNDNELYSFGSEQGKNCCFIRDNFICVKKDNLVEKIIKLSDIKLVGEHNYQNVMCAILVAKIVGINKNDIETAIKSFEPLEHRCEFCGEKNGIKFYNDSKATNPESSIVAINSFENRTVSLIAGGRDKNTSLDEFCSCIKKNITDVILIGEATERFEQNLKTNGYLNIYKEKTLEDAVEKSIELANDIVLFSPACASFDMFKNFEQRGEVFKNYVKTKL